MPFKPDRVCCKPKQVTMMPRNPMIAVLASLLLGLGAAPLSAQQPAPEAEDPREIVAGLEEKARQAYADGKFLSFYNASMKLHRMRPFVPEYMIDIVRACALVGRRTNAYHFMLAMQQQGLSYDFNATPDTESIRDSEAYAYMNDLLIEAGQPAGEGVAAFRLAGSPRDYEAIDWDESRQRFLVGTLAEGKLLAVADDGSSEVLLQAGPENGMWSINGIAVDANNGRLWISSSATPRFNGVSPARKRHGALFEFDLETLELLGSYALPANMPDHELGAVAVSEAGLVYVIDRMNPIVYRKEPGDRSLRAFVSSKELVRLTDISVTPDDSRIFVADEIMGVFVVDPVNQVAAMLSGPETLNLGGLESLEYGFGRLFIMQGGISPQRLMRLQLDETHMKVSEVSPMAIALEAFDRPGAMTISRDSVYYFTNSGAAAAGEGAVVMKTGVDAGKDIVPPDLRQFRKAAEEQQ
jgi:hypothetical protein